jgi:hypothetical protein
MIFRIRKETSMNAYRNLAVAALVATAVAVITPNARAQMLEKMQVTFSGPVELPGEVLPAGSYVFEALENGRLTRVLSADQRHVYATLLTVPDDITEAVERPTIILAEGPKNAPERVAAWFYPGDSVGNEFIYQKTDSGKGLASIMSSLTRRSGRAVADSAKGVAVSSEFLGIHAEHVVVNSGVAIARAAKYLVS